MESHGMEKCLVFTSFQSAQEHMVQILEGCDIPVVGCSHGQTKLHRLVTIFDSHHEPGRGYCQACFPALLWPHPPLAGKSVLSSLEKTMKIRFRLMKCKV